MIDILDQEFFNIIGTTLYMALISTTISSILGIAFGLWLQNTSFYGKRFVVQVNRTLMATPPVVMGVVVYLLLMRNGPLGVFGILFTVEAMIIAQVLLITPIISGMVYTSALRQANTIRAFGYTMGANKVQVILLLLKELSNEIYFAIIAGFGRAMSEVGAIIIVGGNIRWHTRTMTTSITMMRNQGDFSRAVYMGASLMLIAFVLQAISNIFHKKDLVENEDF